MKRGSRWFRKLFRKWVVKECPHLCFLCEYENICGKEWWKYY